MNVSPHTDLLLRLLIPVMMGAVIGLNRQFKHKPAGLRTHALVALGAALVTATVCWDPSGAPAHFDAMSRVIQGLITGIGFLGAGVIMRTESALTVHGLTTAASIWLAACLGVACGVGAYLPAIIAFVLVLMVLLLGGPVEKWLIHHAREEEKRAAIEGRELEP